MVPVGLESEYFKEKQPRINKCILQVILFVVKIYYVLHFKAY